MTPGGGGRRPRSGGHRIPPGSGHVERTRASKPPSISSARIPRATRVAGTARHTATAAPHPPKEGLHLTHPPGHGLHRGVGQIRLHRPPDPLHRVVVETRARTEDEPDPGVLPKPAGDHPGAMDGHVVEEEGDGRDRGVGGQHPLQEPKEAGAGWCRGLGPASGGPWRPRSSATRGGGGGGPRPRPADRARGELGDRPSHLLQHRRLVGIALGHQARSAPAGHLPDPATEGPDRHRRTQAPPEPGHGGDPIGTGSDGDPFQARGSASRPRTRAWSRGLPSRGRPERDGR